MNIVIEELVRFVITSVVLAILIFIYNKLPVQYQIHKYAVFFFKYKQINVTLTQNHYFNNKMMLDWKEIMTKLKENTPEGFGKLEERKNYADLRYKNSSIMLRIGEREHSPNENCLSIKTLTPIKKRFIFGSVIRELKYLFERTNYCLPFKKDEIQELIVDIDLIPNKMNSQIPNETLLDLSYRLKLDKNTELKINKDKIQVNTSENTDVESLVKFSLFRYLYLMLK